MLILKDGKKGLRGEPDPGEKLSTGYDGAFVSDIDFEDMKRCEMCNLRPYEDAMRNSDYSEDCMRETFPTEEEYVRLMTNFDTYAVITPDGEWHAPGKMLSWGMTSETPEEGRAWQLGYRERFIRPAIENNLYMVIVDCHI
jgi:hypothetical protein